MKPGSFQSCTEHIRTASGVVTSLIPLFPFKTPPSSVNRLAPAHPGQRPPRRTSELSIKSHGGVNKEGFCFLGNIAPVCASLLQHFAAVVIIFLVNLLSHVYCKMQQNPANNLCVCDELLALIRTLAPQHTSFHSPPYVSFNKDATLRVFLHVRILIVSLLAFLVFLQPVRPDPLSGKDERRSHHCDKNTRQCQRGRRPSHECPPILRGKLSVSTKA